MNLLILLVVVYFLIRSYQNTIVAMAPLMVLFSMFTIPFVSLVTISLADLLVIFAVLLFPFHFSLKEIKKYPFHICTLVMIVAFVGSNYFGYEKRWFLSFTKILTIYVYPMILWICIKSRRQITIFERSMLYFSIPLILYAFIEAVTFSNPILELLNKAGNLMDTVTISYQYRFGVKRVQSFLPLFGAFGYTVGSFALIMLYLRIYAKRTLMKAEPIVALIVAFVVGVLLTGTRSVMASFAVGALLFYPLMKKYLSVVILVVPIVCIFALSFSFLADIIQSFSDTQSVGGSNSDMRTEQLAISLYYFFRSPIFGNGPTFTFTVARQLDSGLLGAESVWFVYLIEYGLVGCISLLITMIYPIVYLIKKGLIPFVFIVLMFLANKTLSSVPGISEGYFLIYIVFLVRNEEINKNLLFVINYLKLKYAKTIHHHSGLQR